MRLILLVFLVLISACKDTQADSDVGLYDPVPPDGSAFVRFLNLSADEIEPALGRKTFGTLQSLTVSPYYVAKKGEIAVKFPDEFNFNLHEGVFYTIANKDRIIVDRANQNRAKATIAFYNLSDGSDLILKAKKGKIPVLENVRPNSMEAREMNAVKIDFGVYKDDALLKEIDPKIIERGNHYSLIYTGDDLLFVVAETDTRS